MSTSMSSTNKISDDRSSPTPTTDATPSERPGSQETSQQPTSNTQNLDETDEPRQATQGKGLEAVQHILALQHDRIVAMSGRLEELENTIQYIYKNTSTNAILQERHDVRVAALRADSTRATTDNMIQRHTHTLRQINQKIAEIQREQNTQTQRIIDVESRLDAITYTMEAMKDKLQQHSTQQREDPHTSKSFLVDSIEYARVRIDKVEDQLQKHGQTITYMYNYFKPGTRTSTSSDATPVGQYRSKSRTPYDPNPSRPNPTSSSSATQ
ncbi:unnamed protein product [Symbiodinium natans]|uniref:Uncharacterized protein n=1 Tax=Symbiodinium natans TaxID=878477 RepID=A0A812IHY6_9DINO|nr:unnamed protein product [Symbiodinium natans]